MWLGTAVSSLAVTLAVVDVAHSASIDRGVHAELAVDAGWSHSHNEGDIQVYRKTIPSLGTTAWKGITTLPANVSSARLFALLGDNEAHKNYNSALVESVVMDRSGGVTTFYQVVKPPAYVPLSDRFWVCRAINERDADGTPGHLRRMWSSVPITEPVAIREKLESRYPDALEVPYSHGSWDLEPMPDGTTRLTYKVVSDPGGGVPKALAARFAGRSVANNITVMVQAVSGK